MLKVVVFDSGWGGDFIADFLTAELSTVEIIRVIDWKHAPYDGRTLSDVYQLTRQSLKKYIHQVDLIVLAGYTVSLFLRNLQEHYPEQKFVGVGINFYRILKSRNYPYHVTIMGNDLLPNSHFCDDVRQNLPYSTIALPDCSHYEQLIDDGEMSLEILCEDLQTYFQINPKYVNAHHDAVPTDLIESDIVLLLNTHFWSIKDEIEEAFGYRVRVLDFRKKLLRDVCIALNLLGVDGGPSK